MERTLRISRCFCFGPSPDHNQEHFHARKDQSFFERPHQLNAHGSWSRSRSLPSDHTWGAIMWSIICWLRCGIQKWKDKSMEHAHHFFNLLKVSQLGEGLLKKHERNHVARRTGCMVHQSHKDLHGQHGSHTLAFFRLDREAWEVPEKAGRNLSMTISISTEFSLFWRKFDVLDSNLKVPSKVRISKMQALKQVTVSCG